MKRTLSIILTCLLIFSFSINTYASSNNKEENTNKSIEKLVKKVDKHKNLSRDEKISLLTERQCPLATLEKAPDSLLDELLKDEGEFIKVVVKECSFTEDNELKVVSEKEITNNNVRMSVMPTSDFRLDVYVQRIYEKTGDNFKFTAYGNWNTTPYWTFTDLAAIAWSDNFTLYYDSCVTQGIDGLWNGFSNVCPRVNVNNEAGVSHAVSLASCFVSQSYTQVAKVYKYPGETGSANLTANYAHREVGVGSISAGFTASGTGVEIGFSVTPTLMWESAIPVYTDFMY